ncbi:hypothetical protein HBN70_06550 [Pseudomonas lundensis]|uniref:hypothetical protein n=1 Tax=Pseudomonas lundensis TaxID=86185 RepID=UPI0014731C87|nr:hypothetical protein [Pseudomonas lundensis]NNA20424.1 hypothetical protein [Pseudomonas lundensis]
MSSNSIIDSNGNNVLAFPSSDDKRGGPGNTGGNDGGGSMEARVAALEKVSQDIREKLVRVETKLESLEKAAATKTDIADLKTAIAEGFTSQTKWFISTAIALAVIAFTAAKFIHS